MPGLTARKPLRIVFFGTPSYAVPALRALAESPEFDVALVVTQPDRLAGRGRTLTPPDVKVESIRLGLPVHQPESLRSADAREPLIDADADLFVVAAYGVIFGEKTLAIPRLGCLNLHASLLPAYRGASPISAAILNGDDETGVTLMVMERGLDTGPTLARVAVPIRPRDTTQTLTGELAEAGAELAVAAIPAYERGELSPVPQPSGASFVRPLVKADGRLNFNRSAVELERQVRAMWPWPRASASFNGEVLQIHEASLAQSVAAEPGVILLMENGLVVACHAGALRLDRVQAPGGKPVTGSQFAAARGIRSGARFDNADPADRPPLIARVN
jgi:methionyl-tRNA formyltransferase